MVTKKQVKVRNDKLARRTVQLIGFGFAGVLIVIRVVASVRGVDSGISEFLIGGFAGVGVSAYWKGFSNDDK